MLNAHDVYVLVALTQIEGGWTYEELGQRLAMPLSQVYKSLARAEKAHLFARDTRHVVVRNLLEFLIHGVKYAFAVEPGKLVRGVAASWHAPRLSELMVVDELEERVWPHPEGQVRGQSIEPLHESVPLVALTNENLHALCALIDIIRVGSARERKVAADELERRLA